MQGLPSILSLIRNKFNKFNNTGTRMLDSIYHMPLKLIKTSIFGVKMSNFVIFHAAYITDTNTLIYTLRNM